MDSTVAMLPLMTFHDVAYAYDSDPAIVIGDRSVFPKDRIAIRTSCFEQEQIVWRLFHGMLKPTQGFVEHRHLADLYSDQCIVERLNQDVSFREACQSKRFAELAWIGNHKWHREKMIEQLQLSVKEQRCPLQVLPKEVFSKILLILLILSQSKVVLINQLWHSLPAEGQKLFNEWYQSFPGALISLNPSEKYLDGCRHAWDFSS